MSTSSPLCARGCREAHARAAFCKGMHRKTRAKNKIEIERRGASERRHVREKECERRRWREKRASATRAREPRTRTRDTPADGSFRRPSGWNTLILTLSSPMIARSLHRRTHLQQAHSNSSGDTVLF
eukprot:2729124-Rhodomonas_salina.1